MRRSTFSLVFVLSVAPRGASTPAPPPPYTITAIKAVLYHHETADFDTSDVTKPGAALWNTMIGEGIARTPSGATLVLVQVTGTPLPGGELPGTLRLTVHVGSTEIYADSVRLRLFFTERRFVWIPFLVYDATSCAPWNVTATLLTNGEVQSTVSKSIPFACGE